ncbi:hypothetical protein K3M67_21015 (plasmid) [Sphingobium sp. V4]|uniref:hypothetical protein n=1 Tax=Sphingobium sp. V4 TaxID=3038927 RepID=UPI002557D080|nr:hypothetical protein [Sphingobium sp. V4]WIW90492.1 hypothetical protein K3M67_21015 [Sphingobium sp. V4]
MIKILTCFGHRLTGRSLNPNTLIISELGHASAASMRELKTKYEKRHCPIAMAMKRIFSVMYRQMMGDIVPFQPFGYRFDLESQLDASTVKTAIRKRKKRWLEPTNGPRGWILGPFICLWYSAFDRYGPMLFGVISSRRQGASIRGLAGSDLNGVIMFSLLIPLMAFIVFQLISSGQASTRQLVVIALVFMVGGPLIYWSAHKDRREAEPLVRFLHDTVTISGKALRTRPPKGVIRSDLVLIIAGEQFEGPPTTEALHDSLLNVGPRAFVILEAGPETYLQTAFQDGNYVIEMREGDSQHHFSAVSGKFTSSSETAPNETFNFDEVREIFLAYATGSSMPRWLRWERIPMPT